MVKNNAYGIIGEQDTNNMTKKICQHKKTEVLMNNWQYRVTIEIHTILTIIIMSE